MPEKQIANYRTKVLHNIMESVDQMLKAFLDVMPRTYFETNDEDTVLQHLSAILLARNTGNQQQITLANQDATQQTFIQFKSYPGLLSDILEQLPEDRSLQAARAYTADDNSLVIDVFDFGEIEETPDVVAIRARQIENLKNYRTADDTFQSEDVQDFISTVTRYYLNRFRIPEIIAHWQLVRQVRGSLNTVMQLTPVEGTADLFYIAYAAGQIESTNLFKRISRYLHTLGADIRETFLKNFALDNTDQTALVVLLVQLNSSTSEEPLDALQWAHKNDWIRLPYLDQSVLDICFGNVDWSLKHSEILVALCHLAHQIMVTNRKKSLSREAIKEIALSYTQISLKICEAFVLKFRKNRKDESDALLAGAIQAIRDEVVEDTDVAVLTLLRQLVDATLKSNLHSTDRYALGFRLSPDIFISENRAERAFGIFYVHGKAFDGFHVRFRDIARGGVRIVQPSNIEQYAIEVTHLLDEVYQLSFAQQLKNKDIPEGGSKGVILVKPMADSLRCGKCFVNSLLDLVIENQFLDSPRQDYYPHPELLFLGPDENVTVELIEWIIERATTRNYALPNAFMSSKPNAGINHKVYGVTSEGVNVFMEVGLSNIGINPRIDPFTIKITGGPDGDVAGNLIKILHRDYGENARILGVADGSGCAEHPEGLSHRELLRLVQNDLPIVHFDKSALGGAGRVYRISETGGAEARNTLHNRIQSDVFVPAGGRPGTINRKNAEKFLGADGAPSSRLIVEGANLFLTYDAREFLMQKGVLIVKDSSANKCGVICSSYEIIAGMMLSDSEFLEIKESFVSEVLDRLRKFAMFEAKTLFREYYFKRDRDLSHVSMVLSSEIIRITDLIADLIHTGRVQRTRFNELLMMTFFPESLRNKVGDNLIDKLPASYAVRAMASILASRIIYHEGIGYLGALDDPALADYIVQYLQQEERTGAFIEQLAHSNIENKSEIIELMRLGATGTALRWTE
jgi:glutamate dehydrogenase